MLKLLGVMDIISGAILLIGSLISVKPLVLIIPAIYLGIKSLAFWGDFLSVIDGIIALYFIFCILHPVIQLSIWIGSYLFFKGIGSII